MYFEWEMWCMKWFAPVFVLWKTSIHKFRKMAYNLLQIQVKHMKIEEFSQPIFSILLINFLQKSEN